MLSQQARRIRWSGGSRLSQEFFEGVPVMALPSFRQMFCLAFGESRVVEDQFGAGTLFDEFELRDGIDAGVPVDHAPGLHDAVVRNQFDLAANDVATKNRKCAADFVTDCRRGRPKRPAGLYFAT